MCDPTTMFVASTALSIAQGGMQYMAASEQASAQADYQNRQAAENARYRAENAKLATDAYIEESAQENLRLMQAEEAATVELEQLKQERLREQGTTLASSETAGLSFDLLMNDFFRQEAGYRNNARRQLEMDYDQAQMNIKGFRSKAQGRINSVRPYVPEPVSRPSLLGTGLSIAGQTLGHYGHYARKTDKDGKVTYSLGQTS